jgi:hypothetical protein
MRLGNIFKVLETSYYLPYKKPAKTDNKKIRVTFSTHRSSFITSSTIPSNITSSISTLK